MNVLTATGHLGGDAEIRHTPTGKAVTSFSLPVTSGFGDNKKTTWVRCSLWGRDSDPHPLSPYLKKGKMVCVTGEIELREWADKEGVEHKMLACSVRNLTLCGGADSSQSTAPAQAAQLYEPEDDSIPF